MARSIRGTEATKVLLNTTAAIFHNAAALMQPLKLKGPRFLNINCHSGMALANAEKEESVPVMRPPFGNARDL